MIIKYAGTNETLQVLNEAGEVIIDIAVEQININVDLNAVLKDTASLTTLFIALAGKVQAAQ